MGRDRVIEVRLCDYLLAAPASHKIDTYQGDSPPFGALWVRPITERGR